MIRHINEDEDYSQKYEGHKVIHGVHIRMKNGVHRGMKTTY